MATLEGGHVGWVRHREVLGIHLVNFRKYMQKEQKGPASRSERAVVAP